VVLVHVLIPLQQEKKIMKNGNPQLISNPPEFLNVLHKKQQKD
jgi:hypothetical protein